MYKDVLISICISGGDSEYFHVQVVLHQDLMFSPFLFTLVIEALSDSIQRDVSRCMLFTDDIVLVDDLESGLTSKLDLWRGALEGRGFHLSRTKIEYVKFSFGGSGGQKEGL